MRLSVMRFLPRLPDSHKGHSPGRDSVRPTMPGTSTRPTGDTATFAARKDVPASTFGSVWDRASLPDEDGLRPAALQPSRAGDREARNQAGCQIQPEDSQPPRD